MANEEKLKELYLTKSFFSVGKSLNHCFNCKYCRANDSEFYDYTSVLPGEVNPLFKSLPVAVNLFYGDPMIQLDNTIDILKRLEENEHTGPVIIITKGNIPEDFPQTFNLDLHFGLSTFGTDSIYDGGRFEQFRNNLKTVSKMPYKFSIEYRPIIRDVNDSDECFSRVVSEAESYNVGIGYCGLQLSDNLKQRLDKDNVEFKAYDGVNLGMKKFLPETVHNRLYEIADKHNVHIFKKTSCLLAFTHGKERDFNAHYYRPNEVGCYHCPLKEKCFKFKETVKLDNVKIPFDYDIVEKQNHTCVLFRKGICKFPSYDCTHISGKLIHIDEPITTSDVRVIKWLYGVTVDADFTEEPFISSKWKIN